MDMDGAVLRVNVRNFFCHDHLEIALNKNINFIVGRNGSGKSAILTALVVGLGARATTTNRGTNLHSFIKKGANSAVIEIQIKNSSSNAYKRDVYGDCITIIRVINSSGSSSYKIKSDRGETISTKHEDVTTICSVHNIQVDNPICILNQDDARNFHASDSKKKYMLFRKATSLDIIESETNEALNNCIKSKTILEGKKEAFAKLEKDVAELKEKYEEMKTRDEVKIQVRQLEDEYYWSEVGELEGDLKIIVDNKKKQQLKVDHASEKLNVLKKLKDKYNEQMNAIKKDLKEISSANKSKSDEYKSVLSKHQESKNNWKSCSQQLSKKREQIYRENEKVNDLSNEINNEMQADAIDKMESLQNHKKILHNELIEINARKVTTENDLLQTRSAVTHSQNRIDNLTQEKRNSENSRRHLSSQLNELAVRGKNNLVVYGSKMIDLVNAIREGHRKKQFSELPRGPIGSCLKVRDKRFSGTLEHIMGGNVMSFCVNNAEDSRKLFAMMKNIYQNDSKPTIAVGKFYNKVHDVSRNAVRAPRGYSSALDCLQIDDPVVANFLIDNLRLESILLVENQDEAIGFAANVNNVPQNCEKIFTMDSTEFYPSPNYRSYGGRGRTSKYLQVNSSERKLQLEKELNQNKGQLQKIDSELETLNVSLSKLSSQEVDLNYTLRRILGKIQSTEGKMSELESNLKKKEGGHVKVLTEELNLAKNKLSSLREDESNLAEQELSLRTSIKEMEKVVNKLKNSKTTNDNQQSELNEELSQIQLQYNKKESEIAMIRNGFEEELKKITELNKKLKEQEKIVEDKVQGALQLCPRIESPREKKVVITELKKVEAKLNSMESDGLTKQDVALALVEKEKLYKKNFTQFKNMLILIDEMQKVAQLYMRNTLQIQTFVSGRVEYCFQGILTLRGYSGSMIIDHKNCILEIHCTGRDSASVRRADTTNSLSGGERSYATVAFIMALWDCMDLPFYFLDEFDVFMDNVNRKITMDLLIDHAKENSNTQYVFLTPQDTSTLTASDTVKIHRLADPKRRQI